MTPDPDPYHRRRFPAEIIAHSVWLYLLFRLSLRDVELILAERSVLVTHKALRRWCRKFGQSVAAGAGDRATTGKGDEPDGFG